MTGIVWNRHDPPKKPAIENTSPPFHFTDSVALPDAVMLVVCSKNVMTYGLPATVGSAVVGAKVAGTAGAESRRARPDPV